MTAAAVPAASPASTGEQPGVRLARSRRNAELSLLLLAMVLVAAYSATVEANVLDTVTPDFWMPAAALGLVFLGLHLVIRWLAPFADPALLPAVALLNGIGVGFLRRYDLAQAAPADRETWPSSPARAAGSSPGRSPRWSSPPGCWRSCGTTARSPGTRTPWGWPASCW